MAEHSEQVLPSGAAQKPRKKGRTMEQKVGRLKYNQILLKRVLDRLDHLDQKADIIINGLKGAGYFYFSVPMIQRIACSDEVDLEILERVYTAGSAGVFPKVIAAELPEYHLEHYHVSRRIQRMNKRLERETGEKLFEKRGWKWALTSFAFETWGDTRFPGKKGEEVSE